jgi:hypothetical protein
LIYTTQQKGNNMNTWTSERDGRAHVHTLADSKGRYIVQKMKDGYSVDYLYADAKIWEQAVRLSTRPTLAAGKKWVEEHVEAAEAVGKLTLAEIKAKLSDDELYACEIPGTPGRVTLAHCKLAEMRPLGKASEAFDSAPSPSLDSQVIGRVFRMPPLEAGAYNCRIASVDANGVGTLEILGKDDAPVGRTVYSSVATDGGAPRYNPKAMATRSQGTMDHDNAMIFSRCLGGDEVCYTSKATGRLAWARWTPSRKAK